MSGTATDFEEYLSGARRALGRMHESQAAADEAKPPELHVAPPPPRYAETDPMMAFGQPAMWLAAFGSLLTRRSAATAIQAAAAVLQSTSNQDKQIVQHNYDVWKAESENALKLAKFQQDSYRSAIAKAGSDARAATAEATVISKSLHDLPAQYILKTEGIQGLVNHFKAHGRNTASASEHQLALDEKLQERRDEQAVLADHPEWNAQQRIIARRAMKYGKDPVEAVQGGALSAPAAAERDVETIAKERIDKAEQDRGTPLTDAEKAQIRQDVRAGVKADAAAGIAKAREGAKPGRPVLTPQAADMEAKQFLLTGTMPALGFSADARVQILNHAAELAKAEGHTIEDYISGRASWKADTGSLGQITKIADAVEGFERTALENIKVAEQLMNKGAGTAAGPVVNRWIQAGRVATGDPDVAAFNNAMGVIAGEYGKIISGGSASIAAAPEGAREEAEKWLDKIQSPEAIQAQFSVARRDMANRRNSLRHQQQEIRSRIGHPFTGGSQYSSPDDVKAAVRSGAITKDDGIRILKDQFGFE